MVASVYFWQTLRFDVFHVNPPLTRIVSGLPVVLSGPRYDWEFYSSRPQDRSEWILGRDLVAANSSEKIQWCFTLARWSLIPLVLFGGYFGYCLSRGVYGEAAAYVFLLLWCFSPSLLAWDGTICPDGVAAAMGMVALYTLRQWLLHPTWARAAVAGVCLGLLPLCKLTWILAFTLWPLLWFLWNLPSWRRRPGTVVLPTAPVRQLLAMLLLGLYALNTGYLFDGTGCPLGDFVFNSQSLRGPQGPDAPQGSRPDNRFAGTWLGAIPLPLPAEFIQGIDTQRVDFERGMPSYACGQWSDHGWWWYYLYVLVVKMPLGTWTLALLALLVTPLPYGYNAAWRDELLLLLPLVVLFAFVSSQTGFSAHSRYILPALPFGLLWISKVGRAFARRHRAVASVVALGLSALVVSSLGVYPHSLSYFNELAGGPRNGAKHLLDSNLDWGQDLFYLEQWCLAHPDARPIKVVYSGMYPLERTRIPTPERLAEESGQAGAQQVNAEAREGLAPGWYAVSLNEMYAKSSPYRDFLSFQPIAMAGYSIAIYHITPNPTAHGTNEFQENRRREGYGVGPTAREP